MKRKSMRYRAFARYRFLLSKGGLTPARFSRRHAVPLVGIPLCSDLRSHVVSHSSTLRSLIGVKTAARVRGFYILENSGCCFRFLSFFFASFLFRQFCTRYFFSDDTFHVVQDMRGSPLIPSSSQTLRIYP